jgi:DNA-directed DNA polymerase III PolC
MVAHLHVHSTYSFGRSAAPVEELCAAASRRGVDAMAVTDVGGVYAAVPFIEAARRHGIHAVLGAEIEGPMRALLLAESRAGYSALCRVVTASRTDRAFYLPRAIAENGEGLVVITDHPELVRKLCALGASGNLYVEITPRAVPGSGPVSGPSGVPRGTLVRLAREHGLDLVATNPVHFTDPADLALCRLLGAVFANAGLEDPAPGGRTPPPPSAWLLDEATFRQAMDDQPAALERASEIASRCSVDLGLGRYKFPRYPHGDAVSLLAARASRGLRTRLGTEPPDGYAGRLARELEVIRSMGFDDYFLVVGDIAAFARSRAIPMCGRGSAAGSLVSYALGLSDVDPVKHGLYFERFLHEGRQDPPDVDLDFAWDRRDEVIEHVYSRFGTDRVAMISTHTTFAARGALREIAKAHGVPEVEIGRITRRLPWHLGAGRIREALEPSDPAQPASVTPPAALPAWQHEPWRSILGYCARIDGFPKHLGIHAGGIVIAPGAITDHVPLEPAPKGILVTQWDMGPVERVGLVKIDLLGNRSLAVIDSAWDAVERRMGPRRAGSLRGRDPTLDASTRRIMRSGATMGCFYVESPAMRGLLKKLRCGDFAGLVAASSVIRPGVASSGMMRAYIERSRGAAFEHLHPVMERILGETFGVMIYQEDVIRVAHHIGGLSWADGDGMRKAMSGKKGRMPMDAYRERFVEGARARGVDADTATEIWRQMASFGGYAFCKAHSAAFAAVSFQAAFLKARFPAAFMAAVLSNYGGYYSTYAYVSECRRLGLSVKPPCVNLSEEAYTGWNDEVRIGLVQVKGLSRGARQAIVSEREHGPYAGLEDFLERTSGQVEASEAETLVRAGACDAFDPEGNRPRLLWRLLMWVRSGQGAGPLFSRRLVTVSQGPDPPLPEVRPYDFRTRVAMEVDTLGFPVSAHPLVMWEEQIRRVSPIKARDLDRHRGRRARLAGWMITSKPIRTARGDAMEFVSLEDETGIFEAIFFPDTYRRYAPVLLTAGPYLVEGKVEDDFGHCTLTVERLRLLAS